MIIRIAYYPICLNSEHGSGFKLSLLSLQ